MNDLGRKKKGDIFTKTWAGAKRAGSDWVREVRFSIPAVSRVGAHT